MDDQGSIVEMGLYKRAGDLVTLTHSPAWQKKFSKDVGELQKVGEEQCY
jgi:hypothetical protein